MEIKKTHISNKKELYTLLNKHWDDIYSKHFPEDFNFNPPIINQNRKSNLISFISYLFEKLDIGSIIFILLSVILSIFIYDFSTTFFNLIILITIILLPIFLVFLYQQKLHFKVIDEFTLDLQKRITACVATVLSTPINHINSWHINHDFYLKLQRELAQSMLIDNIQSQEHLSTFDDTFIITLNNKEVITTEFLVTTGNSDKLNAKLIFRSYFTIIELAIIRRQNIPSY